MEAVQEEVRLVTLTDAAAAQVRSLLEARGLEGHGLRVFVQGGGCSGLQYGMAFENRAVEGDTVWESGGVTVYVDSVSANYLSGSSIDFEDSVMGGGFRIDNPNAMPGCSTCGQGSGSGAGGGCCG